VSKRDVKQGWCVYCGARCDGNVCVAHRDLVAVDNPVDDGDNTRSDERRQG